MFPTSQEAADAYDKAAVERYGEFAVTNSAKGILRKALVKISKTAVMQTASGFEQELKWPDRGPVRREQFVGRTRGELDRMVAERVRELERQ